MWSVEGRIRTSGARLGDVYRCLTSPRGFEVLLLIWRYSQVLREKIDFMAGCAFA